MKKSPRSYFAVAGIAVAVFMSLAVANTIKNGGLPAALNFKDLSKLKLLQPNAPVVITSINNGKKNWIQGVHGTIKWKGGTETVQIGLVDKRFITEKGTMLGWISVDAKPNSSITWSGEKVCDLLMTTCSKVKDVSAGPYRILAVSKNKDGNYCFFDVGCNFALSDEFTITSVYDDVNCKIEAPDVVVGSQKFGVKVTAKNTSKQNWVAGKHQLSQPHENTNWGSQYIPMTANTTVKPNQLHTFAFDAIAPAKDGEYRFTWQVRSSSQWLGPVCSKVITVRAPTALPDLVIENIRLHNDGEDNSYLYFDVRNIGKAPTKGFFAAAIYVDNQIHNNVLWILDSNGNPTTDPNAVRPLPAGEASTFGTAWYPEYEFNSNTVKIVVDSIDPNSPLSAPYKDLVKNNMIVESNENNNVSEVTLHPRPDLVVQNLQLVQNENWTSINFDVTNVGHAPANSWFSIVLYVDGVATQQHYYIIQKPGTYGAINNNSVVPINIGESYHAELVDYTSLTTGTHTIKVVADIVDPYLPVPDYLGEIIHNNMIQELKENNNAMQITVTNPDKPVLELSGPTSETFYQVRVGESITLTANVPTEDEPILWGVKPDQLSCVRVATPSDKDDAQWQCTPSKSIAETGTNSEVFFTLPGDETNRSNSIVIQGEPSANSSSSVSSSSSSSVYSDGCWNPQFCSSSSSRTSTGASSSSLSTSKSFDIKMSGQSRDYTPGQENANLGTMTMNARGATADIKYFFMAIEGMTAEGKGLGTGVPSTTDEISEVLENVRLQNTVTGVVIDGIRLTDAPFSNGSNFTSPLKTFQIYRFNNLQITNEQNWEVLVDFLNPRRGNKFRIHICGEPTDVFQNGVVMHNSVGCTFGGLISINEAYTMGIQEVGNNYYYGVVTPRGTISGNFHSVYSPALRVAGQSMGYTNSVVKNQKNVPLQRFEVQPSAPIYFGGATFIATAGSLANAENYSLWMDTNGDGIVDTKVQTGMSPQDGKVTFTQGFNIYTNSIVVFEVHADISAYPVSNTLQLGFKTDDPNYIVANPNSVPLIGIETNGSCASVNCQIFVTTVDSPLFTIVKNGDLYVTKSAAAIRNRMLLAGTLGDEVLRLQFYAEHEDIEVRQIQITSSGSTAESVSSLELYKIGEATPFATATRNACVLSPKLERNPTNSTQAVTTFCALMMNKEFVVPEGTDKDVLVRPRMRSDTSARSHEKIAFMVGSGIGSAWMTIEANGSVGNLWMNNENGIAEGGEIFIGTSTPTSKNAHIVGNANETSVAKITSITNSLASSPENSPIPTSFNRIARFTLRAAPNVTSKKVNLTTMVFTLRKKNVSLNANNFRFGTWNTNTQSACSSYDITNELSIITCSNIQQVLGDAAAIEPNGTLDVFLIGDITNPFVDASQPFASLQVSIENFADIRNTSGSIQWTDNDDYTPGMLFNWVEYSTPKVSSTLYML